MVMKLSIADIGAASGGAASAARLNGGMIYIRNPHE